MICPAPARFSALPRFGLLDPDYTRKALRDEHIAHKNYEEMRLHKINELRVELGEDAHGTTEEGLVY